MSGYTWRPSCSGIAWSFFGGNRLAPLSIRCSLPKRSQAPFLRRHYPHHWYYEPVRHPKRPGLSLTGFRLVSHHHRGLPVLRRTSLCIHAVASTPAGPLGARVAVFFQRRRPSPADHRVGSRIAVFEACSAFTARYGLHTRGVALRPFTRRLRRFRYLHPRSGCYRLKQPLSGGTFTHCRAFSRRTISHQLRPVNDKAMSIRACPDFVGATHASPLRML